jgi:hypothetical protein
MARAALSRIFLLGVLVLVASAVASLRHARADDTGVGPVSTQYVFLIDDSASMRGAGGTPNDPDRLAVFAVRAMLTMLDEQDEASVMSLNPKAPAPAIAPLSQNREELNRVLAEDATIASYDVGSTPCAAALERVWQVLEAGKRAGARQVLFFLTDGQCTGGIVPTARWQQRKASGDFDFYYLRFSERESSRELAELAGAGNTTLLSSADAGAMIEPLAKALARSQGYAAYVVDPLSKGSVPAFRGSERVRVLVTSRDAGSDLELRVFKGSGAPQALKHVQAGSFHYAADGKPHQAYRSAFAVFSDEGAPTTYQVSGADRNVWKGVVVPEYRLTVSIETHEGKCDDGGSIVESLRAGSSACFKVVAKDGKGSDVTRDLQASGARVKFDVTLDGGKSEIVASSSPEAWTYERQALPQGVYSVRPLLFLTGREDQPAVRGFPISLSVSNQTIAMTPSDIDAGELHLAGTPFTAKVKLDGTFPATNLSIAFDDKFPPPACTRVRVDGEDLPASIKGDASPGRELEVEVSVHTWCGPNIRPTETFPLRFEFGSRQTKLLKVALAPRGTILFPGDFTVEVEAGATSVPLPATLTTADVAAGASYPLDFRWVPESAVWPEEGLRVVFMNDGDTAPRGEAASDAATATFSVRAGTAPVPAYAAATACCSTGTFKGVLTIASADPPKGVKPYVHPVNVTVVVKPAQAGIWACIGDRVMKGLGVLAGLLFLAYVWNIYSQSHFLPNVQVMSQRIQVLYYAMDGGTPSTDVTPVTTGQVKTAFRNAMRFGKRASAWLKANPLRAGLPSFLGGRPYYETLHISLAGLAGTEQRASGLVGMCFKPELDAPSRIKQAGADGFFIVARGGRSVSYIVCVRERENPIKVTACTPTVLVGTETRLFNPSSGSQIIPGRPTPRKGHNAGIRIA